MNDKFFDIKKEKQDRIMNAVLKVFALNGYRKAGTDEMVREAGISKGLLFHYFTTKAGMYEFVYRYSVKYMAMELSAVRIAETDYFAIRKIIEQVRRLVAVQFAYMPRFLDQAEREPAEEMDADAVREVESIRVQYRELLGTLLRKADFTQYSPCVEKEKLCKLVEDESYLLWREGKETEVEAYLDMLRQMCK